MIKDIVGNSEGKQLLERCDNIKVDINKYKMNMWT